MEDIIRKFFAISSGDDDGYGYSSGFGYGDGAGYGSGDGEGSGDDDGDGYGISSGYGFGEGEGSGDDDGDGYGFGEGEGIAEYDGHKVYIIDSFQTIIDSVHGNYARGSKINSDLTLTPCYIARVNDSFAHGSTLEEALKDAEAKALNDMPIEQRIKLFRDTYDADALIPNADLYRWHNTLTGSCEFGRREFAREHNIDVEHGSMSVRAFIELTKDAFGGQVIRQLKEVYNI